MLLLLLFLTRAAVMKCILMALPRPQPAENQLYLTQEQIETIWYLGHWTSYSICKGAGKRVEFLSLPFPFNTLICS